MASIAPVPPRRYTEEELLALRTSLPFVTCAIKKLNQHPDLGCIVHIPDAAREDPEHFSCKSSMLAEITNGKKAARRIIDSSGDSEPQSVADALGKQEPGQLRQWNLRTRDSSDHSSQPRAAPATKAAQRSENFQKFYRAVVSPTHVRVTAGGRIVPNTRAIAPSQLDWDESEEPTPKQIFAASNNPQSVSWQSSSGQAFALPNVFAPPFIPLPHSNLLPLPLPTMAPHYPQSFPGSDHGPMGHFQMPHVAGDAGGNHLQPGLIKISPPTQFDQSRPFMYNGQWVFPVSAPPGNAPLPLTMLGTPGFFTPPMPSTSFMQQQFPVSMASMQTMSFPGHHSPMIAAGVSQQSDGMASASSFPPVPSMGLNTELLKAQVAGMRFQVQQIEDRSSNIKGQADQMFMEQQRTYLLSQINNMEAMLEHQRAHEVNSNGSVGIAKTRDTSRQSSTEHASEIAQPPVVVSSSMANSKKGDTNEGNNAANMANTKPQTESSNKSRLSIAAALAPPFQPRSQVIANQNKEPSKEPEPFDSPSSDYLAVLDANPQLKAEIEARFAANALSSWTGSSAAVNQSYVVFSNGPIAQGEPVKKPVQPTNMHMSSAPLETTKTTTEEKFVMPPGSVPYLVGTLPRGFNVTSATESDLVYPRPLTDEEIRARHLYWGKAPRSIQRGLPKFDGKDFYPPSPVKGKASVAALSKEAAGIRRSTTPPPMQNPSFEHLFASPYTPTYRSPAQPAPSNDWVSNEPIPAQPVFQNGSQSSHQGSSFLSSMTVGPTPEDFSGLFLEPDTPGYMPPSPPTDKIKETVLYYKGRGDEIPVTPDNPEVEGDGGCDETRSQNSWDQHDVQMANVQSSGSQSPSRDDARSSSTVEITLGHPTPTITEEQTFQQRIDNFRQTENQTQFLQNILKKEAPMVGSALSGTVSPATAQGYLPQYFGSAAASLTPAAMNSQYSGADEHGGTKRDSVKSFAATQPGMATSFLSENRPFNSERYHRAVPPATTAEGYMRYLSDKDEKDKQIIEQGWNANTTGIGPVNGPDW